jgi:hypothetical protein
MGCSDLKMNIFPLGLSLRMEAEGKDAAEAGGEWVSILRCEAALICGRRPGFFPWPRDAYAASHQQGLIGFRGSPERCRRPQG